MAHKDINGSSGTLPGVIVPPGACLPQLKIAFRGCAFLVVLLIDLCERGFRMRMWEFRVS